MCMLGEVMVRCTYSLTTRLSAILSPIYTHVHSTPCLPTHLLGDTCASTHSPLTHSRASTTCPPVSLPSNSTSGPSTGMLNVTSLVAGSYSKRICMANA